MYKLFFEPEQIYVGYFKFEEDPELVPGHISINKNIIQGQLYRAPTDFIEDSKVLPGFGLKENAVLNATGVFRLKDRKDFEISIFGIHLKGYRTSSLDFLEILCQSLIIDGAYNDPKDAILKKVVIKLNGLEAWYDIHTVKSSYSINEVSIKSSPKIVEEIYSSDEFSLALICYGTFSFSYGKSDIKEIKAITIDIHSEMNLMAVKKLIEQIRQIFSLFYNKQLGILEISFSSLCNEEMQYFIFSDHNTYYHKEIKAKNESIIRYSDKEVFKKIISNYLNQKQNIKKVANTFFQIDLNNSTLSKNAFLTYVFELDSFIKKASQVKPSKKEAMRGFSQGLISEIESKSNQNINELFEKWYRLYCEKMYFNSENLQSRLIRNYEHQKFFLELISKNPKDFFNRIVKTRNHLTHPKSEIKVEVLTNHELQTYLSKLKVMIYSIILLDLGVDETFLVEKIKKTPFQDAEPLE